MVMVQETLTFKKKTVTFNHTTTTFFHPLTLTSLLLMLKEYSGNDELVLGRATQLIVSCKIKVDKQAK